MIYLVLILIPCDIPSLFLSLWKDQFGLKVSSECQWLGAAAGSTGLGEGDADVISVIDGNLLLISPGL